MHALRRTACCLLVVATLVLAGAPADAAASAAKAQRRLDGLGCEAGRATGSINPRTRTAIIRFQAANRLAQSGTLTERTRQRLYGEQQVRCDRRPVPAHSASGRRVVVSQRQNYLWLVRAGGGLAAQGPMVDNPSVLHPGRYRVGSKCGRAARIRDNSDTSGRLRLQNFVRFAPCGIGFHRIPVDRSSGRQIHPDWLLGTNRRESHGCLRVTRAMSFRIWDFASVGTRVVVVG